MFKVMSANIRFDNPKDEVHAWPNRKNLIANKINELAIDLFGTQEGRETQLRELENLIGHKLVDDHREWIDERMYPSIYNNKFEIKKTGDIWLSETPDVLGSKSFDSMFPRLATWAQTKDFFICNVHLDHDKEYTRVEQAKVLCEQMQRHNTEKAPIILLGDFNTDPNSDVHNYITSTLKLNDPWLEHGKDEETSFHLFKGIYPEGYRIDWILVSEDFKTHSIDLIKDHEKGIYLSDHFPVLCELELK